MSLGQVGLSGTVPAVTAADRTRVETTHPVHQQLAKRDSVLLVIDTSGWMLKPLGAGGPPRIRVMTDYILKSFGAFPSGMSNGIITFNATEDAAQTPRVTTVIALQPDDTKQWIAAEPKYLATLAGIKPEGGTPLYEAIDTAWTHSMANYQEGRTNRIIVVTDGADQDAKSKVTYDAMMKTLQQKDPAKPIKVTYAAIGPDADHASLQKIATATGQQAAQLNTTAELEQKFTAVLES
ncbi:vWA domain-containing protein [Luteococcus sp.]|uniref:vWA domain-containing protein n=1 Tax=Luteococcus sp. TaxID=1969402 RepID=UPI003736FFAA